MNNNEKNKKTEEIAEIFIHLWTFFDNISCQNLDCAQISNFICISSYTLPDRFSHDKTMKKTLKMGFF